MPRLCWGRMIARGRIDHPLRGFASSPSLALLRNAGGGRRHRPEAALAWRHCARMCLFKQLAQYEFSLLFLLAGRAHVSGQGAGVAGAKRVDV